MTRLFLISVSVLLVCACATVDDPDAAKPAAEATELQLTQVAGNVQPGFDDPEKDVAVTSVADLATELESIEPPPVQPADIPVAASPKTERVCTREKRTGTHRAVRVCRTRAELERLEDESKDMFRELHKSQMKSEY